MKLATKLIALFLLLSIIPLAVVGYLAYDNGRRTIEQDTLVDQTEAFASIVALRNAVLRTAAAVALIVVVLGLFFASTITGPVEKLVKGAEEIGRGNLEYRIAVGPGPPFWSGRGDEISQLADAFNEMAEELRKHRDHLEELVEERTAELRVANGQLHREITERVRVEQALEQKAQELARSNAELEQFAYVASHDLQEPLRMVASYTQLLARRYQGKLDADADDFIAFAVDGANRMQQLINDLLTYSRLGTRGKEFAPTDCEAVLDRSLGNLQMAIEENDATVTHDPLPTVMADEVQLVQLFQNLIGNAVKFRSEAPPRIHVSAVQTSEVSGEPVVRTSSPTTSKVWTFSVRDNGIGIDPRHTERIFVMFQRLHAKGEYPGTGMGLAISKKIVERHGGRIWVESEMGKGSTFCFTIPVSSDY